MIGVKTYSMESMSHLLSFSVNRYFEVADGFVVWRYCYRSR